MTSANYDDRQHGLRQQERLTRWTWEGANVIELTGTIAELFPRVPNFTRHPFRTGSEENRFKDEIRREPLRITDHPLPIATVSKLYSLIQHRDVLSSVFRALKMIHIDISAVSSTILLSEYGERMHWSCSIPNFSFDPGDGNQLILQINCLNSVDTSTVLEITFGWYRLICSNGLMFGVNESQLRRRHIRSLDPPHIAAYLDEQLKQIPQEKSLYAQWYNTKVSLSSVESWVNETVAKSWGPHAACRVWHIANGGIDGDVESAKNKQPHELNLKHSRSVPGACAPVSNLFHVSQALSWIAGTRQTITERLEYVKVIPQLMKALTASRTI